MKGGTKKRRDIRTNAEGGPRKRLTGGHQQRGLRSEKKNRGGNHSNRRIVFHSSEVQREKKAGARQDEKQRTSLRSGQIENKREGEGLAPTETLIWGTGKDDIP